MAVTDRAAAARPLICAAGDGVVLPFKKPEGKSVLRVQALSNDTAEMDLFGIVGGDFWGDGGITKEQFAAELKKLPATCKRVEMRLSSPGGDVFDGRAIANMMTDHRCAFDVNIVAEASSIASIIALAGDTIRMGEGAVMLVHRCFTIAIGNSVDMRALADNLQTIDDTLIATYAKKTGMKPADIVSLMDENRYMSAEEALQKGFVDEIAQTSARALEPLRIAALADVDRARLSLPPLPLANQPRHVAALTAIGRMKAAIPA